MFIQNKKPFEFPSFPFSLIQAIIFNYQNHVCESVIYSWRASMKSFSLLNMFWNFLSCWKKSGSCLFNAGSGILQQRGWIGSAGATQPLGKAAREGSVSCSNTVRLQLDHRAVLPIHLLQHPVSFKSDWCPMVGVKHEKSLVCKLSYPEMHLCLTYLEIRWISKTLSAFLLIGVTEYCWP